MKLTIYLALLLATIAIFGCQPKTGTVPGSPDTSSDSIGSNGITTETIPSVQVADQDLSDTVKIDVVQSDAPGWIAIHSDDNGMPGDVIGMAMVDQGMNQDVEVDIQRNQATPTMYAELHMDAGQMGTFEYPGADEPVKYQGQEVMDTFRVTGADGTGTTVPGGSSSTDGTTGSDSGTTGTSYAETDGTGMMIDNSQSTDGTVATMVSGSETVEITNNNFVPQSITVETGQTVRWINDDAIAHSVSGFGVNEQIQPGQEFTHVFNEEGTFEYMGDIDMTGTVKVIGSGSSGDMTDSSSDSSDGASGTY
jgi:plastocyanin